MNFFEHQADARRRTKLYVLLFGLATLAILIVTNLAVLGIISVMQFGAEPGLARISGEVFYEPHAFSFANWLGAHPRALLWTTVITLGLVGGASLYRVTSLARGGGTVARGLGATRVDTATQEPALRRLVNVVEEMSIAAGVPVPEIYVLEGETGINAFAAGFNTGDAAIAVSRGALTQLTRNELQGVIGHEFSHVLNGDMRLNTRLIGVLFGILVIGIVGRMVLRGFRGVRVRGSSRGGGQGAIAILALGITLFVLGYVGVFFGRLIQAAVSRSRERLADASAVQFTRDSAGLAGALKKIALVSGKLNAPKTEEVSHMLFADGLSLGRLFATHPPLFDRIRAIEPYFKESDLQHVRLAPPPEATPSVPPARAARSLDVTPASVVALVGQVNDEALAAAADIHAAIPAQLLDAAHHPDEASVLMLALMLGPEAGERVPEIEAICRRLMLPPETAARIGRLAHEAARLDPVQRLPLSALVFPALRRQGPDKLRALATALEQLASADGETSVFEYALVRLVRLQLYEVLAPRARHARLKAPKLYGLRAEAQALLSVLARVGHADEHAARVAYTQGIRHLFATQAPEYMPSHDWQALDRALVRLDMLVPEIKQELVEALVVAVSHDQRLTLAEAELLRTVCASLHCPLPPLLPTLV